MSNQKEPQATVLVIDDDDAVRRQLYWTLKDQYQVLEAASRVEAIEILDRHPVDLVLSDLHLPPHVDDLSEGLAIIEAARSVRLAVPVIVITGSIIPPQPLRAGDTATIAIGGLGEAHVTVL
jgi:CheY-like chemotaxis protein